MGWQFTVLSTPMLLAVLVSATILGYLVLFYRDRHGDPLVVLYFLIAVAAIVWAGFSTLKLLQTEPATKLLFYRFLHVGAAVLPPLIFLFVVAFTDRDRWLRYDVVGAVFLLPGLFLLLLFFGPDEAIISGTELIENGLVILRVADAPGFDLFLIYSILLVGASLVLVLVEIRRFGSSYVPQASLIAVAVTTPMLFSVLTAAGVPPFVTERVNLVPTSAAVSVAAFGLLLYRYRLVDLPPLAYATAMKYSPDALFVLDRDERIVSTNRHGSELLEDLSGHVGAALYEVVPDFDPESDSKQMIEVTGPSGELTYYRVFVEPLTRGGRQIGWVVVLRDENDQQRQQKRLEQKNEQLEALASIISHDLRNPLNVAQVYLELARDEVECEELANVESAHTRMEEIIEKVLELAKAGKQIDDLEAIPIEEVVEVAWTNVTTATGDLTVEVDRPVMADPTMMQHVFENFFRNAVDHGGEDVSVTVGSLEDGLYVEDDGPGIPPNEREDVFDAGYTGTTGGTGFGLSIIEQIIDAHEWDIHLTEGTDGGTRFEITGVELAE